MLSYIYASSNKTDKVSDRGQRTAPPPPGDNDDVDFSDGGRLFQQVDQETANNRVSHIDEFYSPNISQSNVAKHLRHGVMFTYDHFTEN